MKLHRFLQSVAVVVIDGLQILRVHVHTGGVKKRDSWHSTIELLNPLQETGIRTGFQTGACSQLAISSWLAPSNGLMAKGPSVM